MCAATPSRESLAVRAVTLAPRLLGAVVTSEIDDVRVAVRITEVEAYEGSDDPASHAFRGATARTAVMFGPPGHLYVYFSYGMHWCANVVCGPDGRAGAVLLRAGEVVDGVDGAFGRRAAARRPLDLARGPARLAACLGLDRGSDGVDLLDPAAPVRLSGVRARRPAGVATGPRVGISRAIGRQWRFWTAGAPTVSTFRPGRSATLSSRDAAGAVPEGRTGPAD